jgi:hypothetical protein
LTSVDALSLGSGASKLIGFWDVAKIGVKFGFHALSQELTDVMK